MPKVSKKYFIKKKRYIVLKLREIAKNKPVFVITIQELIASTDMSQGAIYRYYNDIDEIIGDTEQDNITARVKKYLMGYLVKQIESGYDDDSDVWRRL